MTELERPSGSSRVARWSSGRPRSARDRRRRGSHRRRRAADRDARGRHAGHRHRPGRRAAGSRRDAVPGRRLRQLPGASSTASPTSGRARSRRGPGRSSSAIRSMGTRHCPGTTRARSRRAARRGASSSVETDRRSRAARARLDAADGQRGRRHLLGTDGHRPARRRDAPRRGRARSSSRRARPSSSRSCPGNDLDGLLTPRAAARLREAGVDAARAGRDGRAESSSASRATTPGASRPS